MYVQSIIKLQFHVIIPCLQLALSCILYLSETCTYVIMTGMKRKIYQRMLAWKQRSQGSSALMLDGARRVGKSFTAAEFGRQEYKNCLLIDFSYPKPGTIQCFREDAYDLDLFFAKLSAIYRTPLPKRETLIIFDEVQLFPPARQLIKHLVADGRYDYLETGSLISLHQNVKDILIPSEEEHLEMFPMDFEEFLWALGDEATVPFLRECFVKRKPLGQSLHRRVLNDFRKYMLVGGMPQAVLSYAGERDFAQADSIKKRILTLYREDIGKYAGRQQQKVYALFDSIPGQLAKKEKRFQLADISGKARGREYEDAFTWLDSAMIINRCINATDPTVGLAMSNDHTTQKCYMGDTGLLVTQSFIDLNYTDNTLYPAVLTDQLSINEGMLMENVTAQMLRCNGHKLFFYSRCDSLHRQNHIKIDFLLSDHRRIMPLEVKSAAYRAHSSLDKFMTKFHERLGEKYILYQKDIMIRDGVVHLPLYMALFL